jgi:hypothetical protein
MSRSRNLSNQEFCGCPICYEGKIPLNEEESRLCKCQMSRLNKICWNLRKCNNCEKNNLSSSTEITKEISKLKGLLLLLKEYFLCTKVHTETCNKELLKTTEKLLLCCNSIISKEIITNLFN